MAFAERARATRPSTLEAITVRVEEEETNALIRDWQELGIPVKLVGVGEGIDDFSFFDAQEFARGLVGQEG